MSCNLNSVFCICDTQLFMYNWLYFSPERENVNAAVIALLFLISPWCLISIMYVKKQASRPYINECYIIINDLQVNTLARLVGCGHYYQVSM